MNALGKGIGDGLLERKQALLVLVMSVKELHFRKNDCPPLSGKLPFVVYTWGTWPRDDLQNIGKLFLIVVLWVCLKADHGLYLSFPSKLGLELT